MADKGLHPSVGWIIAWDQQTAASRLQGTLIHEQLKTMGVRSSIIAENFAATFHRYSWDFLRFARDLRVKRAYDVLMFTRPEWMGIKLSQLCRLAGIPTVCVISDLLPAQYDEHFDLTIVPTRRLASALSLKRYCVIEDMIEVPPSECKRTYEQSSDKLILVWVGHPSCKSVVLDLTAELTAHPALRDRIEVRTISKGSWATHQWSLDTVYSQMLAADIAILPMPAGENILVKSANRLALCMALGLPTIATPIPSYENVGLAGSAWMPARSSDEFCMHVLALADPSTRQRIGHLARDHAQRLFAPAVIARQWLTAINETYRIGVTPTNSTFSTTVVDRALRLMGA
ncbi:MAG: hypothetical protein IPM01_28665 [Burkholderiaceae bacterium]|nr:hypothetical protein [Burkholderiaceae bacterium]